MNERITKNKTITIENQSMNISLRGITIKGMEFDIDTVTVKFNNSQFILETLSDIKDIHTLIPTNIFENIDVTLDYLNSIDNVIVDNLINLLSEYKAAKDLFLQIYLKKNNDNLTII